MDSSYIPAGPEDTLASQTESQPIVSSTLAPQSSTGSTGLSPASIGSIAILLSLFGLAALAVTAWWIRRRWLRTKVVDERPLEKAVVGDIEALAVARPIIPVLSLPDVRWTPQIRSISGPAPGEGSRRKLPKRRPRSPPPYDVIKPLDLFTESHPKSAPAHAPSFSAPYPEKCSGGDMSPVVAPQTLAVSGMQTRSLGRSGLISKSS